MMNSIVDELYINVSINKLLDYSFKYSHKVIN